MKTFESRDVAATKKTQESRFVGSHGRLILLYAWVVAIVAPMLPAWSAYQMYQLPVGTSIRPMDIAVEAVVCGLGTPIVVLVLVVNAFRTDAVFRRRVASWLLAVTAIAFSLVPFWILSTVVRWIVVTHELHIME